MNGLVAWWARNPVAGNLLMLAFLVLGILSFVKMEKEFDPPGRANAVMVRAFWPGASPEDMESQVTVRVEEATAGLDGVDWVRSHSEEGSAWVNIQAQSGVDIDAMTAEVRSLVDSISGLPPGMEPLRVQRQIGRNWVFIMSLHGAASERVLRETAERLRDRIALLPGAANTVVTGAREPEVSIELSEAALREYGLTFDQVARAVRASSLNSSGGLVRTPDGNFQLSARNLADTAYDFRRIVVRQTSEGGVVYLGDVANVIDGFEDVNVYSRMNGDPSVLIAIQNADRFNIWRTDEAVQEILPELRASLPQGLELTMMYNQTEDFNALLGVLFWNALGGFALVFLLLMLTLHPKVAFWVTAGVIVAFAGSFFILPYIDVSLNFLSVFGFLLVLGIMVDDAIIVGEAIYERAENGQTGAEQATLATQLVIKPVMASVATTMIAFSPLLLIEGEVNQFTRMISLVVMSALMFSLMECLLILPAHLAHLKKPQEHNTGMFGWLMNLQRRCARAIVWVANHVQHPAAKWATRFRYLTTAICIALFLNSCGLVNSGRVKQVFMPEVEGDFMRVDIELPQTTPFSRMRQVAEQLDQARQQLESETSAIAWEDPNTGDASHGVVRSWSQSIRENTIRAYVALTPPETRELRSSEVAAQMEEFMGPVPDAERISFSLSGNDGGNRIEIALLGENGDDLRAAVEDLKTRLMRFDAVLSARDSEEAAVEELRFSLLPGAEQVGLTLAEVATQVRQAFYGEEVQRLPRDGDDVRVYVRYPRSDRRTLESLNDFRVRTANGSEVPLSSVATWTFEPGVTGLDRRQRMSSILVEAELKAPEARAEVNRVLEQEFFPEMEQRYPTVTRRAIGDAEAQQEFLVQLLTLGVAALFGMYFLLAATFRAYAQPALIMSILPFPFVGGVIGHFFLDIGWGLFSYLGMVAAMGVVVNDNVVLINYVNQMRGYFAMRRRREGQAMPEAHLPVEEFIDDAGQAWDLVRIDRQCNTPAKFISQAAISDFEDGPIEVRHPHQMRWEKSEYREHAQELEALGFRILRAHAQPSIVAASASRFRQIMLTSVTTFIALCPMLTENAVIVQFLKPMALALAAGVVVCLPLTLILTPALYMVGVDIKRGVTGLVRRWRKLAHGPEGEFASAE